MDLNLNSIVPFLDVGRKASRKNAFQKLEQVLALGWGGALVGPMEKFCGKTKRSFHQHFDILGGRFSLLR